MTEERKNKLIALARLRLKHPTKDRLKVIAMREMMKQVMREKPKVIEEKT